MTSVPFEKNSGMASYLARLIDRIGSTPFSDGDRAMVRQHMLDAVAAAFIGCRSKVFQDLTQLCSKVSKGSVWPASGLNRVSALDAAMLWAFAINASVFEKAGITFLLDADTVIISVGATPRKDLAKALESKGAEVYTVGDGHEIGNAMKAIESAYDTAMKI